MKANALLRGLTHGVQMKEHDIEHVIQPSHVMDGRYKHIMVERMYFPKSFVVGRRNLSQFHIASKGPA